MRVRVKVEMVGDDGSVVSEQAMVATVPQSLVESSSADELSLAAALRAMDMAGVMQSRTEDAGGGDDAKRQVRRALGERASRVPSVTTKRHERAPGPDTEAGIMAEVFAFERGVKGAPQRQPSAQAPAAKPAAPSAVDIMRRAAASAPVEAVPEVHLEEGDGDEIMPWPAAGTPEARALEEAGLGIALSQR